MPEPADTVDFFRPRLAEMLDLRHPLAVLASRLPWAQIEATEDTGGGPKQAVVELGFLGVDAANPGIRMIHRGRFKSLTDQQRRWLKRRQAEPAIGKVRCWPKGQTGDALQAVLCAARFNFRCLLRAMARMGLKGFTCA